MTCLNFPIWKSFISVGRKKLSSNAVQKHIFKNRSTRTDVRLYCSSESMVRVLNVAEKNDAARNLSEIMSRGHYTRREGYSKFNKIYQFDYHLFNQPCTMIMTSVSGHLLDLEFAGAYRGWRACNPVSLFEAPLVKFCPENYVNIKKTLEEEARKCSKLVIWTDGDREGENIGFEIIGVCQNVKPNLPVFRARFSEITQQAVSRACQNLSQPDQNTSDAVYVRRELDLRIGAAFTRFQTLRLQRVFPDVLADQLISYGSCQFPTLGFVVERYKQAQSFVPEAFWKIEVFHKKNDISVEFSWKRNRLFEHAACLVLHQKCIEEPEATVTSVKSKSKTKWRPLPLDTVELEKLVSRKLRINAKETMTIAEKLYTQGFISYPRTETNIFPKEIDLTALVRLQTQDPRWGEFAEGVATRGANPRQGTKTDNAHPPIHPIKHTSTLEGNARTIYEFIVRHFLACVSQDAEGFETTVDITLAEEEFSASGLVILARNYLDVYPYDKWSAKEIPEYVNGERFMPESIEMADGETTAPQLLTEADLIALMDKHGIGTDATHAEHIETIKDRLYVGLNNELRFVPGQLGMGLVEGYDRMGFEMSKPALRSELEEDLKRICDGTKNHQAVLQEQIVKYKDVFVEAMNQANLIDEALAQYFGEAQQIAPNDAAADVPHLPVMKCVQCGSSDIVVRRKRQGEGFFLSCMAYPTCKASIWFPDSAVNVTVHDSVCTECRPGPVQKLKFTFKRGSFAPLLNDEEIKCIGGCDDIFLNILGIQTFRRTTSHHSQANFHGAVRRDNGDGNHNGNQNTGANLTRPPLSGSGSWRKGCQQSEADGRTSENILDLDQNLNDGVGAVTCNCGHPAFLRKVAKEGPNNGREFYGCARRNGQSCDFFQWADAHPPPLRVPDDNAADHIVCGCGRPTLLRVVRKEGPNIGRQFYSCSRENGSDCNFFQWFDAPAAIPNNNRPQHGQINQTGPSNASCNCNMPAKLQTVMKEGPNKGRPFYCCNKPRSESCGFFQWADENDGNSNNNNNNRGNAWQRGHGDNAAPDNRLFPNGYQNADWNNQRQNNPRMPAVDNGGPAKKLKLVGDVNTSTTTARRTIKCGLCGLQGHNRKSCPNK